LIFEYNDVVFMNTDDTNCRYIVVMI